MPELPDIEVYREALQKRVGGQPLQRARIKNPFLLRTAEPPLSVLHGQEVKEIRRLGKRLVFAFDPVPSPVIGGGSGRGFFLILHLMIAGRLKWAKPGAAPPAKIGLAAFDFPAGTLLLTEAGTKRRASLHVVQGEAALADHDPGGIDPLTADLAAFTRQLQREVHTLKRSLTDPRLFAGIGNAYSDEILLRAKLSPLVRTDRLKPAEFARLRTATQAVLTEWTDRLRAEAGDEFPKKVTAFRPEMAAHGKFGQPCPVCKTRIQRIVYAENECNYCPKCQTGGKVLADRSLSRLLHDEWPRTPEAWEEEFGGVQRLED